MIRYIFSSAGIGIGKIVKIKEEELNYTKQSIEDTEAEKKRLSDAIEVFIEKTQKMVESMKVTAGLMCNPCSFSMTNFFDTIIVSPSHI